MNAHIQAYDWATHPLGPMDRWPPALHFALRLVLSAGSPQCVAWGSQRYMLYNDAYAEFLGGKPEALGRRFEDIWAEAWEEVGPLVERTEAGEGIFIQDKPFVMRRAKGLGLCFFTFSLTPVHDERGAVGGWINAAIETTGFSRSHRRLGEESAALERQIVRRLAERDRLWKLSHVLMIVLDFDAVVMEVNPAWTATLGWSASETVGRHLSDFVYDGDAALLRREAARLRRGAQRREVRLRFVCREGGPVVRTIVWSVVAADGCLHAVGRDETQDLERNLQLAQAQEHLRQSQKMEAIGQLTGGIAHDFNNMLQGIVLPLQMMQRRLQQGRVQEVQGYIGAALGSARRAASLTQRLLAFSRRQPLDVRPTDVAAMLRGLTPMLHSSCGENITLDVDLAEDLWSVRTDVHQLESAVLNLAINARDAMAGRGTLRVSAANARVDQSHDSGKGHSALDAGSYVRLSVRDSGSGMPDEVIERAFEPFFTTKPVGQGTGLGLPMVYGFMRQTGGGVEIDSQPGRGTTIHLYVPRSAQQPQAEEQPVLATAQPLGHRRNAALVVEDDDTVRALVVELLGEMGFQVTQAASGTEAVSILSGVGHFDLVITDVGLPGPSGCQVADLARQRHTQVRLLLMTGYAEEAVLGEDLCGEGMELLVKPFGAQAFVGKVQEVMGVSSTAAPSGSA